MLTTRSMFAEVVLLLFLLYKDLDETMDGDDQVRRWISIYHVSADAPISLPSQKLYYPPTWQTAIFWAEILLRVQVVLSQINHIGSSLTSLQTGMVAFPFFEFQNSSMH